jgi:hypothetical protein
MLSPRFIAAAGRSAQAPHAARTRDGAWRGIRGPRYNYIYKQNNCGELHVARILCHARVCHCVCVRARPDARLLTRIRVAYAVCGTRMRSSCAAPAHSHSVPHIDCDHTKYVGNPLPYTEACPKGPIAHEKHASKPHASRGREPVRQAAASHVPDGIHDSRSSRSSDAAAAYHTHPICEQK